MRSFSAVLPPHQVGPFFESGEAPVQAPALAQSLAPLMARIQERFRSLALTDLAALDEPAMLGFDQDRRAREIIDTELDGSDPSAAARIREEYFGLGPLAALVARPEITEIIVNGANSVWFEASGRLARHEDQFLSELTYRNFIHRITRDADAQASLDCPFTDGHWNGFRLHLAIPPAAPNGAQLTMRRHPRNPWRLDELEARQWARPDGLAQLRKLVEEKANFLVVGCTGSGKTSVLNACLQELRDDERAVLIEDTSELNVPNSVSTKLLTRRDAQGLLKPIDQTELLRQSLRMRPDRLVMGEIRGAEAKDLLMAFATGHSGCMGTMHAASAREALLRLEMLVQLGAAQWSLHAVRTLILLSLQAVVVVRRDADGSRRLEGIYRVTSLEDVGFLLEKTT